MIGENLSLVIAMLAAVLGALVARAGFMLAADHYSNNDDLRWVRAKRLRGVHWALVIGCAGLLFLLCLCPLPWGARWGIDFGWALHWQAVPSDWILTALILIALAGVLLAWPTKRGRDWRDLRWWKRQEAERVQAQRQSILEDLAQHFDDPQIWLLGQGKKGIRTEEWELVYQLSTGQQITIPTSRLGRFRQRARIARYDIPDVSPDWHTAEGTFEATARHEAGHAVSYAAFGVAVLGVQVISAGYGLTTMRSYESEQIGSYDHDRWGRLTWIRLVSLLAGQIAGDGDGSPWQRVDGSQSDLERAIVAANQLHVRGYHVDGGQPDGVAGWLQAAHSQARAIIDDNQAVIESLVAALKKNRDNDQSRLGPMRLSQLLGQVSEASVERIAARPADHLR